MVVRLAISAVEHLNSSILSNHEVKYMCRDQYTKQMYAFGRSKVTSVAKIESDIVMADKPRIPWVPEVFFAVAKLRYEKQTL